MMMIYVCIYIYIYIYIYLFIYKNRNKFGRVKKLLRNIYRENKGKWRRKPIGIEDKIIIRGVRKR